MRRSFVEKLEIFVKDEKSKSYIMIDLSFKITGVSIEDLRDIFEFKRREILQLILLSKEDFLLYNESEIWNIKILRIQRCNTYK